MENQRRRLLVIEDDLDVAEMLTSYFRVQGYDVQTANWGEDGIRACQISPPDLVILDIRLPDINGYQVAKRLRGNVRTAHIPIIFLTEKRNRSDRLKGLKLGADDYITKPFDIQELRLRVQNALRRTSLGPVINPVTGLPEGALVDEVLQEILDSGKEWVALLISIRNLDAFRQHYGFVTADDVLQAVGRMLQNAIHDAGSSEDFLGHLSASDFLLITHPENANNLRHRIEQRLGQAMEYFYPLKDRLEESPEERKLALSIREVRSSHGPFMDPDAVKEAFQAG